MSALKSLDFNIPVQPWMREAETLAVMQALNEKGRHALFVGGCVRNALLGEEVHDIDIATSLKPEAVLALMQDKGIKVVPTGIDHGTVTAVLSDRAYEITTLRQDIKTDGRHAEVVFSDDWLEDAKRRDFTMNALYMDEEGAVYDFLGNGIADAKARHIRFIGDAEQRIEEDALRVLRFFRFHAVYGGEILDEKGLEACRKAADEGKLDHLSRERITQEFLKILGSDRAATILELMFANSVLGDLRLESFQPDVLDHVCTFQKQYGLRQISARLYAFCGFDPDNLAALSHRLLLPKVFIKDAQAIHKAMQIGDLADEHTLKVALYKCGRVATAQALMMGLATDRIMNGAAKRLLDVVKNWEIPTFPLSGDDLIKQGVKPGPELGAKLEALEEEWIANGFQETMRS